MFQIAIIGAGPAGFYAAESILKRQSEAQVVIFEKLFSPYGLVRSGVAPDHHKIKNVTNNFDRLFDKYSNLHLCCNVAYGEDLTLEVLKNYFHAVIFSTGSLKDRKLGIPGENESNVFSATEFVGWYNSHPEFIDRKFPLESSQSAVIIGQGNVAIDVSRILAKYPSDLKTTDINPDTIEQLSSSKIKDIYIIGRRGPLQGAFTDKELKELCELDSVSVMVDPIDLTLSDEEKTWLESAPKSTKRNFDILKEVSASFDEKQNSERKLWIKFFLSPISYSHDNCLTLVRNTLDGSLDKRKTLPTDVKHEINCDMLFKSIGYLGSKLPGLPFDEQKGIIPNTAGRIDADDESGLYVSGWIKRGPSGVIGTNKADSVETVHTIFHDIESGQIDLSSKKEDLSSLLQILSSKTDVITFQDWKKIDNEEVRLGQENHQIRLKFKDNNSALAFLRELI